MELNSGWIGKGRSLGDMAENLTIEDMATYLLGPVLGLLLRLRGVTCLHASAVAFGETAVAFVGSEGAGKSTTAAALARRGHAILSDDIVALAEHNGSFFVHPAYPYLCLWPESVESLYGSAEALPSSARTTKSAAFHWENRNCNSPHKPCRSLQFIFWANVVAILPRWWKNSRRRRPSSLWWPTRLRPIPLIATCARRNLKLWRALAPSVPIRLLCAHHDAGRLPDLCDLLGKEAQEIKCPKPTGA